LGHTPSTGVVGAGLGHTPSTGVVGSGLGHTPATGPDDGFGFGQTGETGGRKSGGGCGAGVPTTQRQDWPLLQTPVNPDGQPSLQLTPHAPQL